MTSLQTSSLDHVFVRRFDVAGKDEPFEDVHIGTLYLEEDESGFAHDMQIEVYSQNEMECLRDLLEEFEIGGSTEPFLPYQFRVRDRSLQYTDAHGFPEEFHAVEASLEQLLATSSPRLGERRVLLTSVVRAVHGLVGRARRCEPVFTVGDKYRGRRRTVGYEIEFEHAETSLQEVATRPIQIGRFELGGVGDVAGDGTRIDSIELDCWIRSDGRLTGDRPCFGLARMSRKGKRTEVPVAIGIDGVIRGDGGELGWANLFARKILKQEGCFVLLATGHLQRMHVQGEARAFV